MESNESNKFVVISDFNLNFSEFHIESGGVERLDNNIS